MYILIFLLTALKCQFDWTSGSTVLGPVSDWGSRFWQSNNVTINTPHQVSPILSSGALNPTAWTKHIIDADANIYYNAIYPADFDNDGNVDLVGEKLYSKQVVFYKNNGSDSFVIQSTYPAPSNGTFTCCAVGVYAADLDNDGKMDAVIATDAGLFWYKNNGSFNFTKNAISDSGSGSAYMFIDGADIDHSGNISLATTKETPTQVIEIQKNSGGGNFTVSQTSTVTGWYRIRFVDINNDGYPDIVANNWTGQYYQAFLNDGTGFFDMSSTDTFGTTIYPDALWDADFNNDGSKDILIGYCNGPTRWMQNNGTGTGWTGHTVHQGDFYYGDAACAADLDFDGKADIVSAFSYLSWFQQVTLDSFNTYLIDSPGLQTHWVMPLQMGSGTCFKKGTMDILVCWTSGVFAWYESNMLSGTSFSDASLTSSILKVQCDTGHINWKYFGWKTCCPFSNAISFKLRSGTDSANIVGKAFIAPISIDLVTYKAIDSVALGPYTSAGDLVFQYEVNFATGVDAGILDSVWVDYDCNGAGVSETNCSTEFLKVYPGRICYSLTQNTKITLSLYNVSGRLIKTLDSGDKNKGSHWITLPNLPNGSYLAVLNINGTRLTKKLVVIK